MKNKAVNLKEAAPVGSYEYIKDLLNDAFKRSARVLFPALENDYSYYLMYVYPERVICEVKGKYYEITYTFDVDFAVKFGKPSEVEQYYSVKENDTGSEVRGNQKKTLAQELKESNITIVRDAKDMEIDFDFMHLREGSYNPDTGEVEVVLIEAGTNLHKKRHYPDSTIEEAAPIFTGMKMYVNHPTATQDRERPERDLRDWVSTIVESFAAKSPATGRTQAIGKVAIHDAWLRERLKDPVARQHIGLSINTGGKVSSGKVNGQEMQIVEKIIPAKQNGPASVDWVTEAGARGRVSRLLKESAAVNKESKTMELKEAKIEDIQKENPQLLEAITAHVIKTQKDSGEQAKKDKDLKEANDTIAGLQKEKKINDQKAKVVAILKESKLPEVAKSRIEKEFSTNVIDGDKELKEAVAGRIKEELEYLNQFTPKGKIKTSSGGGKEEKPLMESLQQGLEDRMGIKEEEKKEKEEK